MFVTVLFFGKTAELAQTRETRVETVRDASVKKVLDTLYKRFPPLAGARLLMSVNRKYASEHQVVRDGDEIAIFTPVSGG